jgi:hypothetical protein
MAESALVAEHQDYSLIHSWKNIQFVDCPNEKCDLKLFKWSLDSHSKDCIFSMTKSDEIIKQDKLKEHLKTNCGHKIEWMEINEIAVPWD